MTRRDFLGICAIAAGAQSSANAANAANAAIYNEGFIRTKMLIGISTGSIVTPYKTNEVITRINTQENYIKSVIDAGGCSILLPQSDDEKILDEYMKIVDGVMLCGDTDISPDIYGQEPSARIENYNKTRDICDIALLKCAIKHKKPLFCIGRGMQIANIAFGGTLYQDISHFSVLHRQKAPSHEATHKIFVERDSQLLHILGEKTMVNSWHHQAIDKIGSKLKITARSSDKIIEMIENDDLIGIQWHPEMMAVKGDKQSRALFFHFINKCKSSK